jgi:ABC-2 type transport system ATP-binding protein
MDLAIDARGIEKTFVTGFIRKRRTHAVRGIDLGIPRGTIFGLLGPNGAGKTTLLAILATLLRPDRGTAKVLGMDVLERPGDIRRCINMSSGHANFLWSLTVRENLEFYAMLYGLRGSRLREKTQGLLRLFDLDAYQDRRFEACSTGIKQRLALAKALVNDPKVLFLDEPTVGLDPDVSRRIRRAIVELHERHSMTILLTTHNMAEAEALCHEIALIKDGRIRLKGLPSDIKRHMHLGDTIRIRVANARPLPDLEGLPGIWERTVEGRSLVIRLDDHKKRLQAILSRLASSGCAIEDLSIEETSLEDVFVRFAG